MQCGILPTSHSNAGCLPEAAEAEAYLVLADRPAWGTGHEVHEQLAAIIGAFTQQLRRHLQPCTCSASTRERSCTASYAAGLLASLAGCSLWTARICGCTMRRRDDVRERILTALATLYARLRFTL